MTSEMEKKKIAELTTRSDAYQRFASLPCTQVPGGENLCIDTEDVLKLLIMGDSAVRLLVTLGARSV
jgi:hypothetical protein